MNGIAFGGGCELVEACHIALAAERAMFAKAEIKSGIYRHSAARSAYHAQSFRDFLNGKLPARPGDLPTINDWADHVTMAFPEVRLKPYLEMCGADSGPLPALSALPALWVGLLYDATALGAAWDLIKG